MIVKRCENCIHWQKDPGRDWDAACCTIRKGIDCYHNNDQPWKWWKQKEFIAEEEMTV